MLWGYPKLEDSECIRTIVGKLLCRGLLDPRGALPPFENQAHARTRNYPLTDNLSLQHPRSKKFCHAPVTQAGIPTNREDMGQTAPYMSGVQTIVFYAFAVDQQTDEQSRLRYIRIDDNQWNAITTFTITCELSRFAIGNT